jgi:hypothetical protein
VEDGAERPTERVETAAVFRAQTGLGEEQAGQVPLSDRERALAVADPRQEQFEGRFRLRLFDGRAFRGEQIK